MTEEIQKRRGRLATVEHLAHEALANVEDDSVRYGMALDGITQRIAGIAYRYVLDHMDHADTSQCQVCRKPLGDGSAHRIWLGPPDALPANAVLCTNCYDLMLAPLRAAMVAMGRTGCLCNGQSWQWTILRRQVT